MVLGRQVARRPREMAGAFRRGLNAAPAAAYMTYKAGSRALQPRTKDRKKSKGKSRTRKHKTRKGIQKIGSYAGQLIASKPIGVPKAAARIRNRVFGDSGTATNRAWLFGSNMGNEKYYCSLAAEAIMTHMLRQIKDYRSDKGSQNSGSIYKYEVIFSPTDDKYGTGLSRKMVMSCSADSSFNGMVYNPLGALGNTVTIDAAPVTAVTERTLPAQLFLQAVDGYYPSGLAANRDAFTSDSWVYRDTQFGKAQLSMRIRSDFKFQNITPAGAGGTEDSTNINAVDANPMSGKIATFRNQSPTWNKGWLANQTSSDVNILTNFSGRPATLVNWDYKQTGVEPFTVVTEEQRAMPLRMATVFGNAKTSTPVHFPPGGFKSFRTGFSYKGSIWSFMRDTTQVVNTGNTAGKYPPLGDSFALCLVPTMKSIVNEPVKVAFDYHRDGQAYITAYRGGTLPTTNQIE